MKKGHLFCALVITGLLLGGCSIGGKTGSDTDASSSSVPVETISVTEADSSSSAKTVSSSSETSSSSASDSSSVSGSSVKDESSAETEAEAEVTPEATETPAPEETEASVSDTAEEPASEPADTPTPVPTETPAPEPTKTPIVTVEPAEGSNWTAPSDVEPLTATAVTEEEAAASAAQTEARRQEVLDAVEFYLATDYWTYEELMDQLKADGFSHSDSVWAMKHCSVEWEIPDETPAAGEPDASGTEGE